TVWRDAGRLRIAASFCLVLRIAGDLDVFAVARAFDIPKPERLCDLIRTFSAHRHRSVWPADDEWRDQNGKLVHEPGIDERTRNGRSALDQDTLDLASTELFENPGEIPGAAVDRYDLDTQI